MIASVLNQTQLDESRVGSDVPASTKLTQRKAANESAPIIQLALSFSAAAKALDISERTLWSLSKAGKIRSFRIGTARRYHVAELERYIAERTLAEEIDPPTIHPGYANLRRRKSSR